MLVPGYSGVECKEVAYDLVSKGAVNALPGPDQSLGISLSYFNRSRLKSAKVLERVVQQTQTICLRWVVVACGLALSVHTHLYKRLNTIRIREDADTAATTKKPKDL